MPFLKKKQSITDDDVSELLLSWLAEQLKRESITQLVELSNSIIGNKDELFGLKLNNKDEYTLLVQELFVLNMWITTRFTNFRTNAILDNFHLKVYQRLFADSKLFSSYEDFGHYLGQKYDEYNKATGYFESANSLEHLSTLVYKNLHKGEPDSSTTLQISIYAGEAMKAFGNMMLKVKRQFNILG